MVVVSKLPYAEFGLNDHRKDARHFKIIFVTVIEIVYLNYRLYDKVFIIL